jgi:iron complex transport system substrate-binding protein
MAAHNKTLTERRKTDAGRGFSPGDHAGPEGPVCIWLVIVCLILGTVGTPSAREGGPSRIVSLVPAVTEMLFAIGAGSTVVGVSSFDAFPPEVKTRPKVGALIDPDFERILSLKPDLVIVYASQTELMTRLGRAGVPIFKYEHAGLADIMTTIRVLGARVDRAAPADALASSLERDLDGIRRSVAGRTRPRTAVVFDREPGTLRNIYASGGIGFMHDMLEIAGGDNVFSDIRRQNLQATAEILLARAPEIVLEVHGAAEAWSANRIAKEREVWHGLASLPAVRSGRIYVLQDDRLVIPGPRVAEAVRLIATTLHGR